MKITDVKYLGNYSIVISFEDVISGTVHLSDLVQQGIFTELKDELKFSKVYTTENWEKAKKQLPLSNIKPLV
jgi:hypothetical protein